MLMACCSCQLYFCRQEKLRFQAIRHAVTKIDCQPTAESGVVMLVTGQLKVLYDYVLPYVYLVPSVL